MGKGNVTTLPLDDIVELCRNYSKIRTSSRKAKAQNESRVINTLIEELTNFKINILVEFNQIKGEETKASKLKEIEEPLAIYYPRCRNKHALHECPLKKTKICSLCNRKYVID